MPGFKNGPVPTPNYDSNNNNNQFSDVTEFIDDVYIYGTLYADISASDIDFGDSVSFKNVTITDSLNVSGISNFTGEFEADYLTVRHEFNVGTSGTVFVAISSSNLSEGTMSGRVGVGTTAPAGTFQVSNDCLIVLDDPCSVGIATTIPAQRFQIGAGSTSLVVTGLGTLGIGTTSPGDFGINNAIHGDLKADFDGSIRIARNIYDSSGSTGQNGFFMNRDANGIRWVSFTPVETEGVFLQNEGVYVPSVGAAQSFTVLNFVQRNSFGQGTDTLEATAQDPTTVTGLATIYTNDLWGHQGTGAGAAIYRQSRVGINQVNPSTQLDVNGDLHVTNAVNFDSTLEVDNDVKFNSQLEVDGLVKFNDTTDSSSKDTGALTVEGGVGIEKKLFVGNDTVIDGTTESTNKDTGALIVNGGVGIEKNINIGGGGVIAGRLDVDDTTDSTSTTTGSVVIDGGLGLGKDLNSGGSGTFAGTLDVDDTTQSTNVSSGAAVIDGGVGIAKNLNIGQNAKVFGNLELENFLIDRNNDDGVGAGQTDYRLASVGAGVSWRPSGVQTKRTLWVTKMEWIQIVDY